MQAPLCCAHGAPSSHGQKDAPTRRKRSTWHGPGSDSRTVFLASTGASSLRGIGLAAVKLSAACARRRASAACVHECTCFEDTTPILATVDGPKPEDRILARMLPLPYPFCMQEWLQQVLSAPKKCSVLLQAALLQQCCSALLCCALQQQTQA